MDQLKKAKKLGKGGRKAKKTEKCEPPEVAWCYRCGHAIDLAHAYRALVEHIERRIWNKKLRRFDTTVLAAHTVGFEHLGADCAHRELPAWDPDSMVKPYYRTEKKKPEPYRVSVVYGANRLEIAFESRQDLLDFIDQGVLRQGIELAYAPDAATKKRK